MICISKQEAFAMRKLGYKDYVKMSASRHPRYYLVEEVKCLNALQKYRSEKTVK